MKGKNHLIGRLITKLSLIVALFVIVLINSCKNSETKLNPETSSYLQTTISTSCGGKWIDWNVLFKNNATDAQKTSYLSYLQNYIRNYIIQYNKANGTSFAVNQFYYTCPCDSTLFNLSAIPVMGSGSSPVPPPPPSPGTGGSGDPLFVSLNNSFVMDSTTQLMDSVDKKFVVHLGGTTIDSSKILAVMDTGLDSALFDKSYQGLLWSDPKGETIRNFQDFNNFQGLSYYKDDDPHRHGTAVTAIALQALESINKNIRPRVMVLKVLDQNKSGSTFTVSCGLSYAKQHQATLINASLGYYSTGDLDPILSHYVEICNAIDPKPIPILAAAGNLPGVHDKPLCLAPGGGNELTNTRLFYPACFKTKFSNVITVTGLSTAQTSCFYQNYSSTFVSVGVLTKPPATSPLCCAFPVNFLKSGYEGSSFATPVISGKIMGCLINSPGRTAATCLTSISSTQTVKQVTENGSYVPYTSP
jgi:hypothetical protein